jgi:hypothetical protein
LRKSKKQVLGKGKDWNYILDFLLNHPTDSTFLDVLNLAKTVLKHYIVYEVTELMGQDDEMLELLGEPVKLVLAKADAFCQVRRAIFLWRRLSTLAQQDTRGGRV